HLHGADHIRDFRALADVAYRGHDIAAITVEERCRLGAHGADDRLHALLMPFLHGADHGLEQVDVQAAAQASIRRDHDVTHILYRPFLHVHVLVLGIGVGNVADDVADGLGVGLAQLHAFLRLAHLARSHHL